MYTQNTPRPYLKFKEVKYCLGLSDERTNKLLSSGAFPVLMVNGKPYIPANAFWAWLEYANLGGAA